MLRIICLFLLFASTCSASITYAAPLPAPHDGSLQDNQVRLVGRWDRRNPGVSNSYFAGGYLRAVFTGTNVKIKLASPCKLMVGIDGEPSREVDTSGPGLTDLNDTPLRAGTHKLVVAVAIHDNQMAYQGLVLDPGATTKPVSPRPVIEFIGDSITAGGGDGWRATQTAAWLTAEALQCDHRQIAVSGMSVASGFGYTPDKTGMDVQYFRLKDEDHQAPDIWTFDETQPVIIVINLGTNDAHNTPTDLFVNTYTRFVRSVRAVHHDSKIVVQVPFGGYWRSQLHDIVQDINASGDHNVIFLDTNGWLTLPDDYLTDGVHPTGPGHIKASKLMVPVLRRLLAQN